MRRAPDFRPSGPARSFPLLTWQIILLFAALGTLVPKLGSPALLCAGLALIACLLKSGRPFHFHKSSQIFIPFALYLAGFGLGWGAALLAMPAPQSLPAWVNIDSAQPVSGKVEQVDAMPEGRLRIILDELRPLTGDGEVQGPALPAGLAWTWMFSGSEPPLPGQEIKVSLRIREVRGMQNPGAFDIEDYWLEKGVSFRAWTRAEQGEYELLAPAPWWQELRAGVEGRMLAALNLAPDASDPGNPNEPGKLMPGGKAIIPALLMGNKYYLSNEQLDLFAAASLSHSLALSGLHLGLMAAIGGVLACAFSALWPGIMLRLPRPKFAVVMAAPLVLAYMWLGGLTPSLMRAALMFGCMGWLLIRGRPHVIMDGLLWALLIMLVLDPLALHDLRLQLSATCIAAIGLILPWSLRISGRVFPGGGRLAACLRGGLSLLLISLAIQLVLLPLQTWNFGQATPWFVLNLVWLPVLSAWVFPMSVLGLVVCLVPGAEAAAGVIFELAAKPGDWLFQLLTWLDGAGLLVAPAVVRPASEASLAYWLLLLILAILGMRVFAAKARPGARRYGRPRVQAITAALKARWSAILCGLDSGGHDLPGQGGQAGQTAPVGRAGPVLLTLFACAWLLTASCLYERWQLTHPEGPRLTLIDVGQGQAVLFEGTDGERVLVDGGGFWNSSFDIGKSVLAPALTLNRAPHLNAVINTHPDSDHIGGLLYLIKKFKIDALYLGQGVPAKEYGAAVEALLVKHGYAGERAPRLLRAGDVVTLDGQHRLALLHPPLEFVREGEAEPQILVRKTNNASLVLQLQSRDKNLALTCGDIDQSGIATLLRTVATTPGASLASEVLVLPHHGSKHGFSLEFYNAVNPQVALVSAGYGNQWGFPVQIIREELARRNIPLYPTSEYGQVVIAWGGEGGYTVKTARE